MKSQSSSEPPAEGQGSPKPRSKVLIVDDEVNLGGMLEDILGEYDFETAFAPDGGRAVELMKSFKPTVALVDFKLGSVTGLELADTFRSIDPDLPVILMTAYASLDLAVKAIQNDIYDFIAKPIDRSHLLRSIAKAVEKRSLTEENKRLISFLKESNDSLDRLNRMKSKFLSIVTHDLRTPLTSIRGYSEMLKLSQDISKADREKCHGAIDRSVDRMNGLIANLLDMVSIEAGKLRVEMAPLDYRALCEEIRETFAPVAAQNKVKLEWTVPQGPIPVMGDSSRLAQVLTNFITNAFKHTPEGGRIGVTVKDRVFLKDKSDPGGPGSIRAVLTEVADSGEGISAEHLPRLFEQFFQVETSPTRRQGLGLGLTITKEIIVAHQGEIGVHSEGPGRGSTFWFSVPLLPEGE